MGHDHHFLERLERLGSNSAELKLALKLYNDSMLVEQMLAHPAASADRFAVALTDEPTGPHVILCKEGAFVTCLAAGMGTGERPVIPRSYVDRCVTVTTQTRGMKRDLDELTRRGCNLGKLAMSGPHAFREDMRPLLGFAPLLRDDLLHMQCDAAKASVEVCSALGGRKTPRNAAYLLQFFWKSQWLIGTCALLLSRSSFEGWGAADELTAKQIGTCIYSPFAFVARGCGSLNPFLRALHASAVIGPSIVERLMQGYRDECSRASHYRAKEVFLHLAAIAIAHPAHASEIKRTIRSAPGTASILASLPTEAHDLDALFDRPEHLATEHEAYGRQLSAELAKHLSHRSPLARVRAEDVPPDLACAIALAQDIGIDTALGRERLLPGLAFVARAKTEALFVSEQHAEVLGALKWDRSAVRSMMPAPTKAPPAVATTPARKAPCPCGSGEKYKHCCADSEVAPLPAKEASSDTRPRCAVLAA